MGLFIEREGLRLPSFFTAPDDEVALAIVEDGDESVGFEGFGRCEPFLDINDLLVFVTEWGEVLADGEDGGAVVVRLHGEAAEALTVTNVDHDPLVLDNYADLDEIVDKIVPVADLARGGACTHIECVL